MSIFYFNVQDIHADQYLKVEFVFNNCHSNSFNYARQRNFSINDYMSALEPFMVEDTQEYQLVYQFTKLWWFKEVYIN